MNRTPGKPRSTRGSENKSRSGYKRSNDETSREARFDKPRAPRSGSRSEGFGAEKKFSRPRPEGRTDKPFFDKPFRKKTSEQGESRGYKGKNRDSDQEFSRDRRFESRDSGPRKRSFDDKKEFGGRTERDTKSFAPKKRFESTDSGSRKRDFDNDRPFRPRTDRDDQGFAPKKRFESRDSGPRKRDFDNDRPFKPRTDRNDQGLAPKRKFESRDSGPRKRSSDDNKSFRSRPDRYEQGDAPKRKYVSREDGDKRRTFDDNKDFGKRRTEDRKYNPRPKRNFDDERPYRERDDKKPERRERFSSEKPFRGKDGRFEKRPAESKSAKPTNESIRLNRFIATSGICSRREADTLIATGAITVNGQIVTELGTKVKPTDTVYYGDQKLTNERKVYLLLNKPKDFITTSDDPMERKTVMDLVKNACSERIYPVGRLDRNTTGILLLTNDGDMAKKLTHPKHEVLKLYQVTLDKPLTSKDLKEIANGVKIDETKVVPDEISFIDGSDDKREVGIAIHSGQNRVVRRIFEHFGYNVEKLDRVMFAGLTKKDLPRGRYRFLSAKEVSFLKMIK